MDGTISGSTVTGIVEPLSPGLTRVLRRAVLDHARTERRRVYPPTVHVGVPGRAVASLTLEPADGSLDHALRVDCLEAMVGRVHASLEAPGARRAGPGQGRPIPPALLVWLTRVGPLQVQDVDLAWSAATASAAAESGARLAMVVVDKQGWRDVRTGTGRSWRRIRDRTTGVSAPT